MSYITPPPYRFPGFHWGMLRLHSDMLRQTKVRRSIKHPLRPLRPILVRPFGCKVSAIGTGTIRQQCRGILVTARARLGFKEDLTSLRGHLREPMLLFSGHWAAIPIHA